MSILDAIKELKRDNSNLQDLALLPQPLIMQMAQRGEIQKELVPLIISKKAEMIDAAARNQALARSGQTPPSVMEQKMAQIAQSENPAPAMMPQQTVQMPAPQLPEEVGIAQNPVAPMQMAGGGIIAFANTGLVDDEDEDDDTSYEDYLDEIERSKIESMIMNTYRDSDMGGAGIAYAEPSMPRSEKVGIKTVAKETAAKDKEPDDMVKRLQAQIMAKESGGRRYDKEGKLLTSSKGAEGEMQVMPYTARDPGFGVRPARDNSPDELRRVGDEYAAAMYRRYGDPKIAMIAYNMGPGATDQWLADGADPRKLPKETQGYIRGVNLAGGGVIAFSNRGRVVDDFGNLIDEEKDKKKPLTKEAQRALAEKAASEAKVKGVGPVRPAAPAPGISSLGATAPTLGLTAASSLIAGLTGPDQVNIPTAADVDPGDLTAEQIEAAKRPALIYPRIRGKERYTSELPATRDQKARPITASPLTAAPTATTAAGMSPNYTPDEAGSPYRDGMPPMISSGATSTKENTEATTSAQDKLFAQMQDAFSKREARLAQARELDPYLALMSAGLGIAGGTSPYALTNIGQGGAQGVAQYAALQRGRAAEEAGLGSLQNKMLSTAMLGELRRDQMEQAKAGKEATLNQNLLLAKNKEIEKALADAGITTQMIGMLNTKRLLKTASKEELEKLKILQDEYKNIENRVAQRYASPGSNRGVIKLD